MLTYTIIHTMRATLELQTSIVKPKKYQGDNEAKIHRGSLQSSVFVFNQNSRPRRQFFVLKAMTSALGSRHRRVWGRVDVHNLTLASKEAVSSREFFVLKN